MRCIICKQDSSNSKSVEHIIPESLGNEEHVLPVGVVCDSCNNYISRKIEKPLLDTEYFKRLRFHKSIESKKGRIPPRDGFHFSSGLEISLYQVKGEGWCLSPKNEKDASEWINLTQRREHGSLFFTDKPREPDEYIMSRFLTKVGIEVIAQRSFHIKGGLDEIINKPELDELRTYIRRGYPPPIWPFHSRRIYPEYDEVIHEYMLLYTKEQELYIILALFGVEYSLNLGGPEITGYLTWLSQNKQRSPLEMAVEDG